MMKAGKAVIAGLSGGIAMTILGMLVRQMGMDMNAEMMLGTMLVSQAGTSAWIAGLMIHLVLSVIFALIYAWGFERITHRAGVGVGLGFAVIHIIGAGIAMAMIPAMHPMIPEMMPPPGAFMSGMGAMGIGLFVLEHLMYGAIVGGMYGTAMHQAGRAAPA
jgi:hypothetical protein